MDNLLASGDEESCYSSEPGNRRKDAADMDGRNPETSPGKQGQDKSRHDDRPGSNILAKVIGLPVGLFGLSAPNKQEKEEEMKREPDMAIPASAYGLPEDMKREKPKLPSYSKYRVENTIAKIERMRDDLRERVAALPKAKAGKNEVNAGDLRSSEFGWLTDALHRLSAAINEAEETDVPMLDLEIERTSDTMSILSTDKSRISTAPAKTGYTKAEERAREHFHDLREQLSKLRLVIRSCHSTTHDARSTLEKLVIYVSCRESAERSAQASSESPPTTTSTASSNPWPSETVVEAMDAIRGSGRRRG